MKITPIETNSAMGANTPEREVLGTPALSNNTINVGFTVQMDGAPAFRVTLENESDARNLCARFAPKSFVESNSGLVLEHITDATDEIGELLLATAKAMGLSLPAGL